MLLADHLDRRAGDLEPVAGAYDASTRSATSGACSRSSRSTAAIVQIGTSRAAQVVGVHVVGVLVGDQHGVGAVERRGVGEARPGR